MKPGPPRNEQGLARPALTETPARGTPQPGRPGEPGREQGSTGGKEAEQAEQKTRPILNKAGRAATGRTRTGRARTSPAGRTGPAGAAPDHARTRPDHARTRPDRPAEPSPTTPARPDRRPGPALIGIAGRYGATTTLASTDRPRPRRSTETNEAPPPRPAGRTSGRKRDLLSPTHRPRAQFILDSAEPVPLPCSAKNTLT